MTLLTFHLVYCFRYMAILPSFIPGVNQQFKFTKGDIQDKRPFRLFASKSLKDRDINQLSFYKVKNKRLFLRPKSFERPIDFHEMFKNRSKYVVRQPENIVK